MRSPPRRRSAIPSLLLIRHAQASFGAADYDVLSELGGEQVRALVDGLQRRGIVASRVICGGLRRQRETAQPCADAVGTEVTIDERWDEYVDRDILTNHAKVPVGLEHRAGDKPLTSREFQEILNGALRKWIHAGEDGPAEETWPQFRARATAALDEAAGSVGKGETALVVSSGGVIAALTATLLGVAPEALIAFNHVSVNTGITKLAIGRGGTTLISVNEHAHLEEAGTALLTYR